MTIPDLRSINGPIRTLLIAYLLAVSVGYVHGTFLVRHTTEMTPAGISERFIGSEAAGVDVEALPPDREIQYEKSVAEVLNITHTHIIVLSMLFFSIALIFLQTSVLPTWLRKILVAEPFAGILVIFGGMWLVRFVHPGWSVLIAVAGTVTTVAFFVMVGVSMWELGGRRSRG